MKELKITLMIRLWIFCRVILILVIIPLYGIGQEDLYISNEKVVFKSNILGLQFKHYEKADIEPFPKETGDYVLFDKNGRIDEVKRGSYFKSLNYTMPIEYPRGFSLGRHDVNGMFWTMVYDRDKMLDEQLEQLLEIQMRCSQENLHHYSIDDVKIWIPSFKSITQESLNSPLPSLVFPLAILDENRFIMMGFSKLNLADTSGLKNSNWEVPRFDLNESLFFSSLNYHGISFRPIVGVNGDLELLEPYINKSLTPTQDRTAIFNKYSNYAGIPELISTTGKEVLLKNLLTLAELDRKLIEHSDIQSLPMLRVIPVSPSFDTISYYHTHNWEEVGLSIEHKILKDSSCTYEREINYRHWSFDQNDAFYDIISYPQETKHQTDGNTYSFSVETDLGRGVTFIDTSELVLLTEVLHLPEFESLKITISYFKSDKLTNQQISDYLSVKMNNRNVIPKPTPQIFHLDDWVIFINADMMNDFKSIDKGPLAMIKTSKGIYEFSHIGGFKSNLLRFLNNILIDGKKLRATFDKNQKLENIWIE